MKNEAVYTAALVADGWAGAENFYLQFYDGWTDGPTDQKVAYRVACPLLKIDVLFGEIIPESPLTAFVTMIFK